LRAGIGMTDGQKPDLLKTFVDRVANARPIFVVFR
jgi:hypothetical protein